MPDCEKHSQPLHASLFFSSFLTALFHTSPFLDARWLENGGVNCFTGNTWNQTDCPSTQEGAVECTQDCAVEGATYQESYGITTEGNSLTLSFVTKNTPGQSALLQGKTKDGKPTAEELTNVGSRTYLMDTDDSYMVFKLKNREFSFDLDASNLPCGLNGALYFVEMAADGGKSQ